MTVRFPSRNAISGRSLSAFPDHAVAWDKYLDAMSPCFVKAMGVQYWNSLFRHSLSLVRRVNHMAGAYPLIVGMPINAKPLAALTNRTGMMEIGSPFGQGTSPAC